MAHLGIGKPEDVGCMDGEVAGLQVAHAVAAFSPQIEQQRGLHTACAQAVCVTARYLRPKETDLGVGKPEDVGCRDGEVDGLQVSHIVAVVQQAVAQKAVDGEAQRKPPAHHELGVSGGRPNHVWVLSFGWGNKWT